MKSNKSRENNKTKVLWGLKETKDRGVDYSDAGHEKEIKSRAQARLDLGPIHLKNPTAALAKALEGLEQARVCHLWRVNGELEVLGSFIVAIGLMEACSWMTKMTFSLPMRKGEHFVENFLLCSSAHPTCSPLLQGFLHPEELCKVALTWHGSLDVIFCCQD